MVKTQDLGRSLIKNQHKLNSSNDLSQRHTEDAIINQSITENTSLDDFLAKTKLANKQFKAESANMTIVKDVPEQNASVSNYSSEDLSKELLIPRRPNLDKVYNAEMLKKLENENYLKWRRKLADLQEKDNIILTPFEKNLEFWRQLWRVVERSDILIQILDARNPLLFYCEDLEKYIEELGGKKSVILLNKSDYLTAKQRKHWLDYFSSMGTNCVFFSALEQQAKIDQIKDDDYESDLVNKLEDLNTQNDDLSIPLGYQELISYMKSLYKNDKSSSFTIGFVGYPNVGKSSTINALLRAKRVSVSVTPGKTKHFQTIKLDEEITICDCPGLVFPNIVSSKSEMIINGILPIDQIKDVMVAIGAITSKVPAHIFESLYGIILNKSSNTDHNDSNRKITPLELLTVYGYSRGFMTQRGLPDTSKAAKFILKDFVVGKILYCYAPPNVPQEEYHIFTNQTVQKEITDQKLIRICEANNLIQKDFDKEFFKPNQSNVHIKDPRIKNENVSSEGKPWKKHNKRNKKEKLRRVYAHLDN